MSCLKNCLKLLENFELVNYLKNVFPFKASHFWGGTSASSLLTGWFHSNRMISFFTNSLLSFKPTHIESERQIKTFDDNEIYLVTFSKIRVMGLFVLMMKRMRICLLIDWELGLQLQNTINYANSLWGADVTPLPPFWGEGSLAKGEGDALGSDHMILSSRHFCKTPPLFFFYSRFCSSSKVLFLSCFNKMFF